MIDDDYVKKKDYKCEKCNKNFATKSNLNRHTNKCILNIKYKCEYCEVELYEKENLKRHLLICKEYEIKTRVIELEKKIDTLKEENKLLSKEKDELKKEKDELKRERDEYLKIILNNNKEKIINNNTTNNKEKIINNNTTNNKEKIINNNTTNNNTNNISIINITIEDLNINGLRIHDLMDYGNSIANYVLRQTDIQDKIKLRDRSRKLIEYSIEDKKYNDKGRRLIIFIMKNYEDKIIKLLRDTYGENLDNMSIFNEHLNRLKNIRDNELKEIIIEERTDNQLGREIFETLLDNLNKDSEIKYMVKE